jgi:cobalt-zinc-cadmium efflux system outer membrane protein
MSPFVLRAAVAVAAAFPVISIAAPLTLNDALQLATQRSEAARAAKASASGAGEAARAAGQLPDPVLGLSLENLPVTGPDRFSTTRDSMTMKRVGLSQEWVSAEKRSLRTAAATAMVAREAASFAVATADARVQAALAYIDSYYAGEALKLSDLNESHAREAIETAKARLASGTGNAQEVLGLTSAQGMAEDESADLLQQLASTNINLTRWTGREPDQLLAPVMPALPDEQEFVEAYPAVVAKRRDIEVARQEAAVAASNRTANWTWQVAYGQRTGFSDMATVGVNIPLQVAPAARQDRETASKVALVQKAEAELAEATRAAQGEYLQLVSEQEHHVHRIERYQATVLLPAVQRTAAATASYRSNQANVTTVFEARHAELEARRKLLNMQRELTRMRAQLAFKPLRAEEIQ